MSKKKSKPRRQVRGLKWANKLKARPATVPKSGSKSGAQRQGLAYEKRVATYLQTLLGEDRVVHGQWFEFEDSRGAGWCQTDIIILPEKKQPLVIVECKLTARRGAGPKLLKVYKPIVRKALGFSNIRLVQICRNLKKDFEGDLIEDIENLWDKPERHFVTLNLRRVPRL